MRNVWLRCAGSIDNTVCSESFYISSPGILIEDSSFFMEGCPWSVMCSDFKTENTVRLSKKKKSTDH